MRLIHTTLFVAAVLALSACKQEGTSGAADTTTAAPTPENAGPPETPATPSEPAEGKVVAVATLAPTQGNDVAGQVEFFQLPDGQLHVTGKITGLAPNSQHGFHIHEKGDCSAPDGASAGGHFNPASTEHGNVMSDPHHGGDMPNIVADAQGNATVSGPVSSNVDAGKGDDFDIIGRGLIVHADADDYKTQPTGNAGARLACAVIKAP
ncbi:superoxide dismutase family protein [Xanthomonas massiliensis]|jgi:Cu-Zn family superoxide dismutase|uniref:superoxide dismutase family protein n=1 Tax=Xanthomonas massiliensis TaxID=1720302 RepID=UPI000824C4A8|nr:superoxide dismutase family protein [Xanthomonas massiliensis]